MRYHEIIESAIDDTDAINNSAGDSTVIDKIQKYLLENCQPYLEQIGYDTNKYVLYRGIINGGSAIINVHRVRLDDRAPSDTPGECHRLINNYFTQKFGEPFRNAMFATSVESDAAIYAIESGASVVFPIGNFTFVWSPRISDMFTDFIDSDGFDEKFGDCELDGSEERLFEILPKLRYQNTDLKAAISSGHEIMIRCKNYVSLPADVLEILKFQ